MRPQAWMLALLGTLATVAGLSCIIPDRDIQVRTTDFNLYPVRFVEGITLTDEAGCNCNSKTCECPLPDLTLLPTFLDPSEFPFCICGENKVDDNRLPGVFLYVEDQDEVDGEPADSLYAAAVLDWSPSLLVPVFDEVDYVAYRSYLDPNDALSLQSSGLYETDVIKRPRPYVRSIGLQDLEQRFDLCNGSGRAIEPGFHTISFIVTDREWSKRVTAEGMEISSDGVPDIAAGATYDIQTYVFQCLEEGAEGAEACDCVDPMP